MKRNENYNIDVLKEANQIALSFGAFGWRYEDSLTHVYREDKGCFDFDGLTAELIAVGALRPTEQVIFARIDGDKYYKERDNSVLVDFDFKTKDERYLYEYREYTNFAGGRRDIKIFDEATLEILVKYWGKYRNDVEKQMEMAKQQTPANKLLDDFLSIVNRHINLDKYTAKIVCGKLNKETGEPYKCIAIYEDGDYMGSLVFSNREISTQYQIDVRHVIGGQSRFYFELSEDEEIISSALIDFN